MAHIGIGTSSLARAGAPEKPRASPEPALACFGLGVGRGREEVKSRDLMSNRGCYAQTAGGTFSFCQRHRRSLCGKSAGFDDNQHPSLNHKKFTTTLIFIFENKTADSLTSILSIYTITVMVDR
jgi:hypothetical protein